MPFCQNTSQQINLFDSINKITERKRKRLQNSWAEKFGNEIFTQRPNCPVSEQKKRCLLKVSETMLHRSALKAEMGTSEYQEIADKRAGYRPQKKSFLHPLTICWKYCVFKDHL